MHLHSHYKYKHLSWRQWSWLHIWISFVKNEPQFALIVVDGKELERVASAKLLGLTSNFTWNEHISEVIKKASKRLYFLVPLKRSRVPRHDMSTFYTACIRSVLTYAAPAFFYSLPKYLTDELVRVEKRVMSIICPGLPYQETIELVNIVPIVDFIRGYVVILSTPLYKGPWTPSEQVNTI